jgi:predicted XRE-type DNA-binding protein
MSVSERSIESSGNVFEDLGFDKAEASTMLFRAKTMLALSRYLRASGKTQTELAELLGIGQSRVSDLMKGKAKLFSLDMLLSLAQRIGMKVTVAVEPRAAAHARAAEIRVAREVGLVVNPSSTFHEVHRTPWGTATAIFLNAAAHHDSVGVPPARIHDSTTVVGAGRYQFAQVPSDDLLLGLAA